MIPPFDERGNLPPGIHKADWNELEARLGGTPWRRSLLLGLREALECLRVAGCLSAYVDGSFVSADEAPGDFDVCWEPDGVDFTALDPALLDFSEGRLRQKRIFRGELFPADMIAKRGLSFLDFFQLDRVQRAKGVIEIDLASAL